MPFLHILYYSGVFLEQSAAITTGQQWPGIPIRVGVLSWMNIFMSRPSRPRWCLTLDHECKLFMTGPRFRLIDYDFSFFVNNDHNKTGSSTRGPQCTSLYLFTTIRRHETVCIHCTPDPVSLKNSVQNGMMTREAPVCRDPAPTEYRVCTKYVILEIYARLPGCLLAARRGPGSLGSLPLVLNCRVLEPIVDMDILVLHTEWI